MDHNPILSVSSLADLGDSPLEGYPIFPKLTADLSNRVKQKDQMGPRFPSRRLRKPPTVFILHPTSKHERNNYDMIRTL